MVNQGQAPEKERRDWVIILIILLIGFLCVIIAGGWAIRFAPTWRLNTNMGSNIDPNSDFLTNRPDELLEPLDPSILTQPAWINVFLTPGASFETSVPVTSLPTNTPAATSTTPPTAITSPTASGLTPSPTNTLIYFPPPTNTPIPPQPPTNTPLPSVDLAVTKDDGNLSYIAGGTATYTIVISNNGPANVTGAVLTDNKPTQITTWSWACTSQNGGATGCDPVTNSNTNFTDSVNLPNGASIVYTVTANILGNATGDLVNTANINVPSGYTDTVPGNNSDTDTNTLTTISADLSITKISSSSTYTPGSNVVYTVTVTNTGPDGVTNVVVSDNKPAQITTWDWACTAQNGGATGCNAVTNSNTDFSDTVDLPSGASIVYTVTATISGSATGDLINNATVDIPTGVNDPNVANNSTSYTHTQTAPSIDLSITKDDGSTTYSPGATLTYTIVVTNNSSATATGFNITDTVPFLNNTLTVFCTPSSGGDSCGTNATAGTNVAYNNATLSASQTLTIVVTGTVSLFQSGPLSNTANIVIPGGAPFTDPVLGNNSATDTDTATLPTCDVTTSVPGTGNVFLADGQVTCLSFTDATLIDGANVSVTNTGITYLRWDGKDADDLTSSCSVWSGLLWIFGPNGNTLNNMYIDRNTDIILYAQALLGNDTLTFTSITNWTASVCP